MRKKRSLYNMVASIGSYSLSLIFSFITQAVFISILGVEYLGINGLFTNIITMLSLTELGLGTTIIYKLYKPIAQNDKEKVKSWMNFYKKCYRIIALCVLLIGIAIIPFLGIIVGDVSINENIIILYLIQILDTVFSYCMTYKRSLLYADQKNYVINIVHMGYIVLMNITQIIFLYLTKNYICFLLIKVIYRILENIIINLFVNKNYSYIKESYKNISKVEQKDIFKRMKAIFIQKVSFVINKGIDNIVISMFLGVAAVGYYTNYFTIISAVCAIIFQLMSSFSASIGNLLVEENKQKSYDVYKKINMLNSFMTGGAIVLCSVLIEPFIKIWIGEEYILSKYILISFLLYLYCDSIRRTMTMYKDSAGICIEDKHMYIIMTIINLSTSIVLCKFIGISGVILGTALGYLFLIIFSYPKYVFEPIFKLDRKQYYSENFKYLILIVFTTILSYYICYSIEIDSIFILMILRVIISISIFLMIFYILYCKSNEFLYYKKTIKSVLNKLKHTKK